jgi:hypothetical protein
MRLVSPVLLMLILMPGVARAQSAQAPPARADIAVSAGWFTADRSLQACCSSWSSGLFKGLSGGYYWTDHLKTEAEISAPGTTEASNSFSVPNGMYPYSYGGVEQHRITTGRLSVSQAYQFGHNSTFHPFVRAGVDVDRDRDDIDRYVFTSGSTIEQRALQTTTNLHVFVGVGFKAYFTERAFFRGEAKFSTGVRQQSQMLWTAGVGIDLSGRRRSPAAPAGSVADTFATPRAAEPIEIWRAYASKLTTDSLVDVALAGGEHFTGTLVAADDTGIDVRPDTRVVEPQRRIPFAALEQLALRVGPRPGTRVGAALAGIGTGYGVFTMLLLIGLSHFGG